MKNNNLSVARIGNKNQSSNAFDYEALYTTKCEENKSLQAANAALSSVVLGMEHLLIANGGKRDD